MSIFLKKSNLWLDLVLLMNYLNHDTFFILGIERIILENASAKKKEG